MNCWGLPEEFFGYAEKSFIEFLNEGGDEMKKEYVEWCRTDEGKKYLEGGEEYERRLEKRT
jgi:hypothetical protein